MNTEEVVRIRSSNYWFKISEFLQTDWALIDENDDGTASVRFITDSSAVFDELHFTTLEAAVKGLLANGFDIFYINDEVKDVLVPPKPPFKRKTDQRSPIYSSKKFWRR